MSWRRKCSKGSRDNPVIGAVVIKKGGGGGDKVRNSPLPWQRELNKALEEADGMSTRVTKDDVERMKTEAQLLIAARERKRSQRERAREAHKKWLAAQTKHESYDWALDPDNMAAIVAADSDLEGYLR